MNQYAWVCSNCLRAGCWAGIFYCEDAKSADLVVISRQQTKKLGLEHTDWFDRAEVRATREDYTDTTDARKQALIEHAGWKGETFKVGDKVVHVKSREVRTIAAVYTDIKGGVRLDRAVRGFVSWNVADLRRAKQTCAHCKKQAVTELCITCHEPECATCAPHKCWRHHAEVLGGD